jgi:ABC-2 type transport system ATP-binding protein
MSRSSSSAAISTRGLRKEFRRTVRPPGVGGFLRAVAGRAPVETTVAVKGLDLEVARGERIAFIGPNGSGKSTTIKMLTGILHPSGGEAEVLGFNPWRERNALAYHLGSVFGQKSQLWFHLPPIETFFLLSKIFELDDSFYRARVDYLVEAFGIAPYLRTPVRKLSLGERMRCELVASLLHRPSLLLLDEPTIGLDVVAKGKLREHIREANELEGTTIFITSHDAGDVETLAERVVVISEGAVIFDGPVDELRGRFLRKKRVEAKLTEAAAPAALSVEGAAGPWSIVRSDEYTIVLDLDDARPGAAREAIAFLMEHLPVEDITIAEPPLEEVIRAIYDDPHKPAASPA